MDPKGINTIAEMMKLIQPMIDEYADPEAAWGAKVVEDSLGGIESNKLVGHEQFHIDDKVLENIKKSMKQVEDEALFGPDEVESVEEEVGFEVVCVSDIGIEQFQEGVEYVAEDHPEAGFIYVYDDLGQKREMFSERFKRVGV